MKIYSDEHVTPEALAEVVNDVLRQVDAKMTTSDKLNDANTANLVKRCECLQNKLKNLTNVCIGIAITNLALIAAVIYLLGK